MNREILFKAKRKDWKELPKEQWWVEGYYVYCRKRHYILPVLNKAIGFDEREDEWIEIDPDTICQYTGITDKNGRKIWENDIVNTFEEPSKSFLRNVIKFEEGCFKAFAKCYLPMRLDNYEKSDFEVCGNIFDNAELLEVE